MSRALGCVGLLLALGSSSGCKSEGDVVPAGVASSVPAPAPKPPPVDHLARGELTPGRLSVFGLPVPRGMRVDRSWGTEAHLLGEVEHEALLRYLRERVNAQNIELGPTRVTLPNVTIRGAPPGRIYDIEIVHNQRPLRLVLRDVTPPPSSAASGLSEADRWRKYGIGPDGRQINAKELN